MAEKEALLFLETQIDERIADAKKKRNSDKSKSATLKMTSVVLAGVVTVLVGLQGDRFDQKTLRNLALTLGATITVVNTFDAFYDHKSLWIKRTSTLAKLYNLKRELNFEVAKKEPGAIDNDSLTRFHNILEAILKEDLQEWLKLRSDTEQIISISSNKSDENNKA
jgi:uncharacterized membrane protein